MQTSATPRISTTRAAHSWIACRKSLCTPGYFNDRGLICVIRYIQRYSYFGSFRSDVSNVGPNAAMLTQKGELTDIGAWYLGQAATGKVPKGDASTTAAFAAWSLALIALSFCYVA